LRESLFDVLPAVPDLQHQPALRRQMRCCFSEDAPHQVEAVFTAVQRERRFAAIFRGQGPHYRFAHVRRIAEDDIVAFAAEALEQVGADQLQPLPQIMFAHVTACHGECGAGNVHAIDLRFREDMCRDNGQTAGARA